MKLTAHFTLTLVLTLTTSLAFSEVFAPPPPKPANSAPTWVQQSQSIWHAPNLHYSSIGAFMGTMDTEMLGKGDVVGGTFEWTPLPFISLHLRGGYADGFDGIEDLANYLLPPIQSKLNAFSAIPGFSSADLVNQFKSDLKLEDFSVVPLEIGLVGRFPVTSYFNIYAGGGWGYYVIPTFEALSGDHASIAEDIGDISGGWFLAGAELGLHPVYLFAEVKYTHIVANDFEIEINKHGFNGTLTADLDLSGTSILGGLRLKW